VKLGSDDSKADALPEAVFASASRMRSAATGPHSILAYMELCLYEPDLGLLLARSRQFGRAGDFYTSSDVHAVFGRLLARQFEEMWRALDSPERIDVIELGLTGTLRARCARLVSQAVSAFACVLHYALVEQSPHLARKLCRSVWPSTLPPEVRGLRFPGVGRLARKQPHRDLGNESSTRCRSKLSIIVAHYASASRADASSKPSSLRPPLKSSSRRYSVSSEEGERVEAPLASLGWMDRIANVFQNRRGFLVLIDYGYTREEQLAGRHRDTVMSYRQHTAGTSPYQARRTGHHRPRELHALRARHRSRTRSLALLTQSQFLIGIGEETQFADAFQDCRLPQERAKVRFSLST